MKGLDSAIKHFRKLRDGLHRGDSNPRFLKQGRSAPSREQLHAAGYERLREFKDAIFFGDAQECTANRYSIRPGRGGGGGNR
jgi:hypothetical protein